MSESKNIAAGPVEDVYGEALFELALKAGQIEDIREEAAELRALLLQNKDLARLIDSRALSHANRTGAVERLFSGNVSDLLYRFIRVVNAKGRLAALPGILEAFRKLADARAGMMDVDAYVAKPMADQDRAELAAGLSTALSAKVTVHAHVDPTLIGGLKLRVGDRLVDGSVASQLRRLKREMVEAGRAKAKGAEVTK